MRWLLVLLACVLACGAVCDENDSGGSGDDDEVDDDVIDDDVADDDTTDDDVIDDDVADDDTADDDTVDDDTTVGFCYRDRDGDDFGDPLTRQVLEDECDPGWVENDGDCNDNDPDVYDRAPELAGDGVDQDCSGADLLPSDAAGIFVAKTGNDNNPGTMAQPKLTISAAVEAAQTAHKAVFVAAGDYQEKVRTRASLYGGYEAAGWTRDIEGNLTIISDPGETCLRVEGPRVAIEGFTLHPISINRYGVAVEEDERIVFHRNIIYGGIYSAADRTTLARNTITSGIYSGAVHMDGVRSVVVNNLIWSDGGIMITLGQSVVMHNTVFLEPRGAGSIGIVLYGAAALVFNNLIIDESPYVAYGVVAMCEKPEVTLLNNHFWGEGEFYYVNNMTDLAQVNDCSWLACAAAGANQAGDPLLVDDYHLDAASPCVDAGVDPTSLFPVSWANWDYDGQSRPAGEGWDIGADEYVP